MDFPDHFSGHAAEYSAARPVYPPELYEFLASVCETKTCAWDCATGSGQAAFGLAPWFDQVIATDASANQVENPSGTAENVFFRVAPAEASGLENESVDLVTVAQALHWFRFAEFFAEVKRVTKPGGIVAVWSYALTQVDEPIDALIGSLYRKIDAFWPPERVHVERQYADIPFPFETLPVPEFRMQLEWTADRMLDYLRTWSAVKRCIKETGEDPVSRMESDLRKAWTQDTKTVRWPLHVQVGRVTG